MPQNSAKASAPVAKSSAQGNVPALASASAPSIASTEGTKRKESPSKVGKVFILWHPLSDTHDTHSHTPPTAHLQPTRARIPVRVSCSAMDADVPCYCGSAFSFLGFFGGFLGCCSRRVWVHTSLFKPGRVLPLPLQSASLIVISSVSCVPVVNLYHSRLRRACAPKVDAKVPKPPPPARAEAKRVSPAIPPAPPTVPPAPPAPSQDAKAAKPLASTELAPHAHEGSAQGGGSAIPRPPGNPMSMGTSNFLPYEEAAEKAQNLKLSGAKAWRQWCTKGQRPTNMPSNPDQHYKGKGWRSWGAWLGTGNTVGKAKRTSKRFPPFEEALEAARALNLKGVKDWQAWCKRGDRPKEMPSNPDQTYKGIGWKGAALQLHECPLRDAKMPNTCMHKHDPLHRIALRMTCTANCTEPPFIATPSGSVAYVCVCFLFYFIFYCFFFWCRRWKRGSRGFGGLSVRVFFGVIIIIFFFWGGRATLFLLWARALADLHSCAPCTGLICFGGHTRLRTLAWHGQPHRQKAAVYAV